MFKIRMLGTLSIASYIPLACQGECVIGTTFLPSLTRLTRVFTKFHMDRTTVQKSKEFFGT